MKKMKWMQPKKPELHVVSVSGGKDSTAMLLRMIEEGMRIDLIIFCDTGLEFPEMYDHLALLERNIGRPITRICANHTFEHYLTQHEVRVKHKKNSHLRNFRGYGWPGPLNRWCTKELKHLPRERFLRPLKEKYEIIEYVGLAADEGYRLERESNQQENLRHPLVDWGMTEADCLQYCYDRGYTWGGLYRYFSRVSCWCCPLQPLAELRILYEHFPHLWATLKEWDSRTWRHFKSDGSVAELERRFDFEKQWTAAGKETKGKEFYAALKEYMKEDNEDVRESESGTPG